MEGQLVEQHMEQENAETPHVDRNRVPTAEDDLRRRIRWRAGVGLAGYEQKPQAAT
jgi:hypothetical protein